MLFNPNFQSGPVWAGFRPFQAEKTGDSDPDKSGGIPNLLKRCAALGQFDFNINPGSEVKLHQSINSLGSRLHDVEQALVGADFELFTGLFVNVEVTTGENQAPVTVNETAIQTQDGKRTVYLRVPGGSDLDDYPKEFHQAALSERPHLADDDADHASWVHERLSRAVTIVREGRYPATPGPGCTWCPFASSCPAKPAGRQVVA